LENVTLTAEAFGIVKKVFAYLAGLFCVTILIVRWCFNHAIDGSEIIRAAASGVGLAAFAFWVFFRWGWRWKAIPKLIGRPNVRGVWLGKLTSNYRSDETGVPLEKHIVFVIRQTYLTLCIQSFTERQTGVSKVEALIQNNRTNSTNLSYVYELKNEYSGQSTLVNGAGDLSLIRKAGDTLVLKGAYWTSTPTHGHIVLRRITEDCDSISEFADACQLWPIGENWEAGSY
jgi:hypothetical protein